MVPGYAGLPGRYDECVGPDGAVRPHWAEFLRRLGPDPAATLRTGGEASARAVLEHDVSMNVYAGARSEARPWPLDTVPMLVNAADWSHLSAGLRQRVRLYNALLTDLYGPQTHLRSGAIPGQLAMANPHFLRPCVGLGSAVRPFLHTYAVDIARAPDGQWWVLQDRLDAPSGLGYSLQNRLIAHAALRPVFHGLGVHPLSRFFAGVRAAMLAMAPERLPHRDPRVVFLTPGPANETYFEHAYLARYWGFPLVEGADLTTRNRQVFLRTVGGLKRVDTIVRRIDSAFCDPLELIGYSLLGVPGLVNAAQAGQVALANQLGGAAWESPALLAFLGPLCRAALGEDLRLPSVATWWCGQPEACATVRSRLRELVIKPAFRERGAFATRYGALGSDEELAQLTADVTARPQDYCGQERVILGTTPAWVDGALKPVPFVMRLFVTWQDGDYHVMPGGLTRFDPSGADAIVSLQQGSSTKDTWILAGGPLEDVPVTLTPAAEPSRRSAATPSRLADNLFWFGRYLERTSQLVRTLDRLDPLLRDEISALDPAVAADCLNLLLSVQQTPIRGGATADELAAQIRVLADDANHPGSLAASLGHVIRLLDQVKVTLPPEFWRSLRSLRTIAARAHPQLEADLGEQLAALEALGTETLTHDTSWRFLQLGRRIERAQQILFFARTLLSPARTDLPLTEFRLQTLLHFTDNLFTYRGRYRGAFEPASILHWLLEAPENPRGLRYQVNQIAEHLAALPEEVAPRAVGALRAHAFRLGNRLDLLELGELAGASPQLSGFYPEAVGILADVSDRITQIYFSHAEVAGSASFA